MSVPESIARQLLLSMLDLAQADDGSADLQGALNVLLRAREHNIQMPWCQSPVHHALENGLDEFATHLVCHGFEKELLDSPADIWSLAANGKNTKFLKHLESVGCSVNLADDSGRTALMQCANAHDVASVRRLIEASADVNAQDEDGNTALHFAAFRGNLEICSLLLAHGADLFLSNKEGLDPEQFVDQDASGPNVAADQLSALKAAGRAREAIQGIGSFAWRPTPCARGTT